MKLSIDDGLCMAHGRCFAILPQLLESDDEGYPTVKGSSVEVPAELADAAAEARDTCPEAAISILAD